MKSNQKSDFESKLQLFFSAVAKIFISLASVSMYECTPRQNQGFSQSTVKPRLFTKTAGMRPWQDNSQHRGLLTALQIQLPQ